MTHHNNCLICKNHKPFEMPKEIVTAAKKGKLSIFAGSGVSTESRSVLPFTFYDQISYELNIDPKGSRLSFDELMSLFVKQTKEGRRSLISEIYKRFDRIESFTRTYSTATSFHREVATIPHLNEIFTTNWDNYFENVCGALPIVTSEDFIFSDLDIRKVYKLHGSINNVGSIVATTEDYKTCYKNLSTGLIGSKLKLSLASETILFIGYSFTDFDFNKLFSFIRKQLKGASKHIYIVTLDPKMTERMNRGDVTVINTDATYFIHSLKHILVNENFMIDDLQAVIFEILLDQVLHAQEALMESIDIQSHPEIIYSAYYLEGMNHACQFMLNKMKKGQVNCLSGLLQLIDNYRITYRSDKMKQKNYFDVSYIDGYVQGLILPLLDFNIDPKPSLAYLYGYKNDIKNIKQLKGILKNQRVIHKGAHKKALNLLKYFDYDPSTIIKRWTFLEI